MAVPEDALNGVCEPRRIGAGRGRGLCLTKAFLRACYVGQRPVDFDVIHQQRFVIARRNVKHAQAAVAQLK